VLLKHIHILIRCKFKQLKSFLSSQLLNIIHDLFLQGSLKIFSCFCLCIIALDRVVLIIKSCITPFWQQKKYYKHLWFVWINRDIRRRGATWLWLLRSVASAASTRCALVLEPPHCQDQEPRGVKAPLPRPNRWCNAAAADACPWWGGFAISSRVVPSSLCFLVLLCVSFYVFFSEF
jgi:hypothetical protein